MSDEGVRTVRNAIEGAGRAFQVVDGGRGGGGGPTKPPHDRSPPDRIDCPLVFLGHLDGHFHFLDARGQKRHLGARALGNRQELLALFLGSDTWLRQAFPKKAKVKRQGDGGEEVEIEITVDFRINDAARHLIQECGERGLYGEHVVQRAPGVWPSAEGLPIVHCGDEIMINGRWQPAGTRTDSQVWAAASPMQRPGLPGDVQVARKLQADLRELWSFRRPGAEIAVLGLLCAGYYGAAINWRPAGFFLGGAGSGKSALLRVCKAASPMHHYSNDTSKAGIEQAINGRAMPIYVDESSDRQDQSGARALLDLVLAASGGEGTRGVRGSVDGQARTFQIAGSVIYASISPPDLQPQHLGRFTLIELGRPEVGADNSDAHRALEAECKRVGPCLWGRALAGAERYALALVAFRRALSDFGCVAREMDQIGALLAGWWVLTEESVPDSKAGLAGVSALQAFIRGGDETDADDGPRRMVNHLVSSMVQMSRSTDRKQVGMLIARALQRDFGEESGFGVETARVVLADHGMRVIRGDDTAVDRRGRSAPRAALGNGVWFSPGAVELRGLFKHTMWEGERWIYELKRLESAREPKMNVRIGAMSCRAIWVSAEELGYEADADG